MDSGEGAVSGIMAWKGFREGVSHTGLEQIREEKRKRERKRGREKGKEKGQEKRGRRRRGEG